MKSQIDPVVAGVAAFAMQAVTFEALIQRGLITLDEARSLTASAISRFDDPTRSQVEFAIRSAFPGLFDPPPGRPS